MTTLAIVGGGIAGRSLLYALAKEKGLVSRVQLFQSDDFFHPCSLNSTAIVAPRGVSEGHSPLGNLLMEGFKTFQSHVEEDSPRGVSAITQYTAASEKMEGFKLRYPNGQETQDLNLFKLKQKIFFAKESGFLIRPETYLSFLLEKAEASLPLSLTNDMVSEIIPGKSIQLKTHRQEVLSFDQVILAGGVANRHFGTKSKVVQGSYLEFPPQDFGPTAFSLTLNGDNLIYSPGQYLLIGSTTQEVFHELSPELSLRSIYDRLVDWVDLPLPKFQQGAIRVGLREKAGKRMPYSRQSDNLFSFGGFYKNGFGLALSEARKLIRLL